MKPLSDRQEQILAGLKRGLTDRQIAAEIFVSPHTVNFHTRRIYAAFGVHSRTELLAKLLTVVGNK